MDHTAILRIRSIIESADDDRVSEELEVPYTQEGLALVHKHGVGGNRFSDLLAQRVAEDHGCELIPLVAYQSGPDAMVLNHFGFRLKRTEPRYITSLALKILEAHHRFLKADQRLVERVVALALNPDD